MKLQSDLREFIELLLSRGVDFVVVGGHAVAFHGYPRLTDDVDLLIRPTLENGRLVIEALDTFGFGALDLQPSVFTQPDTVIQLGREPNRIDLLTEIYGVSVDEVWDTKVEADLDGLRVSMIGKHALIQNKKATARLQDLADVERLESKD